MSQNGSYVEYIEEINNNDMYNNNKKICDTNENFENKYTNKYP